MKVLDIALKDMTRSFRSVSLVVFMFVIPLLVTGMFYFMFGNIAQQGEFELPQIKVVVANLDHDAPRLRAGSGNTPEGLEANTLSELVVEVLQGEDLADLLAVSIIPDGDSARSAVDNQRAQVAIIIPEGFSRQFADQYSQAVIEFYQDPTLTIGPSIVKSILNQFIDSLAGVKIAIDITLNELEDSNPALIEPAIQQYLDTSLTQNDDLSTWLLAVRSPNTGEIGIEEVNPVVRLVGPIMGGMMIFFAFYTGTSTAQSILREEEERTLPRLFTTPTPQAVILAGKFMAVFLTVAVQMTVLLIVARFSFAINWGSYISVGLVTLGTVFAASSFGILVNSMLKDTKQGGTIFGGVLTLTGMVGMISVFTGNSPGAGGLGNTVPLIVPQGWAVRGLLLAIEGAPVSDILLTMGIMFVWSAIFFGVGVWRFQRRYM
jgi:ABC-2 type transport system permease protein